MVSRSVSDEAIVLKTYDVGEADRYCVLLARGLGRISVGANGVRRLASKRGASLLTFQRIEVMLRPAKGSDYSLESASIIETNGQCASDLRAFSLAEQAVELVLRLIHEGESVEAAYDLLSEFLRQCTLQIRSELFSVFAIRLLMLLGLFPDTGSSSISHRPFVASKGIVYSPKARGLAGRNEDPLGKTVSPQLHQFLRSIGSQISVDVPVLSPELANELQRFVQLVLEMELDAPLKVAPLV